MKSIAEWLLTGEGEMLKYRSSGIVSQPQENDNNEVVSLLKDKIALLENNALQEKEIQRLEKEIHRLKGKDIYAMEEKIENQRQEINVIKKVKNIGTSTAFSSSKRV